MCERVEKEGGVRQTEGENEAGSSAKKKKVVYRTIYPYKQ